MPENYNPFSGTISTPAQSKWFVTEDRLNNDQKSILAEIESNIDRQNYWIKGFAGSGKSILLLHVAKKIQAKKPNASIVLIVFTRSLVEMFRKALTELNPPLRIRVMTYFEFMRNTNTYDYILCDEVQDLTPRVLKEMYRRSAHIVIAGDVNQSIFTKDPKWNEATLTHAEIPTIIYSKDQESTIVERLPLKIFEAVKLFKPQSVLNTKINLAHTDGEITFQVGTSKDAEINFIINRALLATSRGYTAGILLPTQKNIVNFVNQVLISKNKPAWDVKIGAFNAIDFDAMNLHLKNHGVKLQYVGNGNGEFKGSPEEVVIMTYHSAKGLDFDNVFIPFCNQQLWISFTPDLSETLFFVAMTRPRRNLYLTYNGTMHDYLRRIESKCKKENI